MIRSTLCCLTFQIDTPMLASEWKRPGMLTHFTVVRKLDGGIFPLGFSKEVTDRNTKAGSNVLCVESRWKLDMSLKSEYFLYMNGCLVILSCFLQKL